MIYFGIDFGTSNSCIAYFNDKTGEKGVVKPRVDELALRGGNVVPTIVALNDEGHLYAAGYFALACGTVMGCVIVDRVKQWIGRPFREVIQDTRLQNLPYSLVPSEEGIPVVEKGVFKHSAESIVSYFLQFLLGEAYASLHTKYDFSNEPVSLIVTYPAYYLQTQVDAIREAVNLAARRVNETTKNANQGLNISHVKLIPEPLATICAAVAEGKIDENDKYVLVIDEGAGTLDVMLVNIGLTSIGQLSSGENKVIEASGVTIGGMERLGGMDMDNAIFNWIRISLLRDGFDLNTLNNLDIKRLMTNIEDAKIALSAGRTSEAHIGVPKFEQVIKLSIEQMNSLISDTIERCKISVQNAIKEIEKKQPDFNISEISKVILIGGPTQMQIFKDKMYEALNIRPIEDVNPMEYVALGAAVSPSVKYKVPVERTYGLIHKSGEEEEFQRIVEKDTSLPVSIIKPYKVDQYANKIVIEVAQIYNENDAEIECRRMGKYEYLILPKKSTYSIIFSIDEERKVQVAITDSETKALAYQRGIDEGNIFHLKFFKESDQLPCVISKNSERGSSFDPIIKDALQRYAATLFRYISMGYEQVLICERIFEYDIDLKKRSRLEDLKNEVNVLTDSLLVQITSLATSLETEDGKITQESITKIKEEETLLRQSDDFENLVKKINSMKQEFEDIRDEIKYGQNTIRELLEKISKTEAYAIEIIRRRNIAIEEKMRGEISGLMDELDRIKKVLERHQNHDILVISPEGQSFRDGASKEQMLKCIIDQITIG